MRSTCEEPKNNPRFIKNSNIFKLLIVFEYPIRVQSFLAGKSDKVSPVYLFNLDLEEGFVGAVRGSLKTKARVLQGRRAQRALSGSESWSFRAERNGFKKPDEVVCW